MSFELLDQTGRVTLRGILARVPSLPMAVAINKVRESFSQRLKPLGLFPLELVCVQYVPRGQNALESIVRLRELTLEVVDCSL